jgi:hypothetical protein
MNSGRIGLLSWAPRVAAAVLLLSVPGYVEPLERSGDLPPALVVVEGAANVVGDVPKDDLDMASVSYEVKTPYPASAVIAEIQGKLESAGWKPLPRQSVSPIHPSSLRAGWRTHANPFRGSDDTTQSFLWNAQWRNSAGDVVAFTLTYRSKTSSAEGQPAKPDNDTLRVNGSLSRSRLLPLEGLPQALIVLNGAKDISAWRFKDEQRLGYDFSAPRPPAEAMAALGERLEKLGWRSEMEPPPAWRPESDWATTHKPGWNFGTSRGYGGHLEWRSTWRNTGGSTIRYVFIYAGVLPAGATEDPEQGVTNYYVEVNYSPSGKMKALFFPPPGTPSVGTDEPGRPRTPHPPIPRPPTPPPH